MRRDEPWCFEALLPGEELKVRPERLMQLYERIESELYHVADGLFAVQASPLEVAMSAMADVESAGHRAAWVEIEAMPWHSEASAAPGQHGGPVQPRPLGEPCDYSDGTGVVIVSPSCPR